MEKGFTLVELLAILVILGVITLVSVPSIISTNKKSRENDYLEYQNTVKNAAEVWVETHLDEPKVEKIKNGGSTCLTAEDLNASGLINGNMVNPEDNEIFSNYGDKPIIYAYKSGSEIIYQYIGDKNYTLNEGNGTCILIS